MSDVPITKDTLDGYLKELGKEFRKRNGTRIPAEIILIGGASVLINYGFREMTYDVDAIIQASSAMKDAINQVGDRMQLPNGWLNTDFTRTTSYSPKLVQYSRYYKTFANVLKVRTVSAEYLVVMKLMAGRQYKNDLSDIVGILLEQRNRDEELSLEKIRTAANHLYGGYENIPAQSRKFVEATLQNDNLEALYQQVRKEETENKDILITFQNDYPDFARKADMDTVLAIARKRKSNQ